MTTNKGTQGTQNSLEGSQLTNGIAVSTTNISKQDLFLLAVEKAKP